MTRQRFAEIVEEAVAEIPSELRQYLDNVSIEVLDAPTAEDLRDLGLRPSRDTIFGLFDGVPIGLRDSEMLTDAMPDRIVIYYRPLVRTFRTPWSIRRQVRRTVVHEIAHFFGLDEDEVAAEGYE